MSNKTKVAAIEASHMHVLSLIKQVHELPEAEFVGFADANPRHRESVKQRVGLSDDLIYTDYRKLLDERKPDAVMVCSTNADHVVYTEELAARGVHVMLEKPFAARLAHADRMVRACQQAGVTLMVNWPTAWNAALRHAREIAQSGQLGQVFQITFRGGHTGPTTDFTTWWYRPEDGGGVFLDYICYSANIFTWVLGKRPLQVCGMAATLVKPVRAEDNAVVLMRYDTALCIAQATWTRFGKEPGYGPVINGTEGSVTVLDDRHLKLVTKQNAEGEVVEVPPLTAPGLKNGPDHLVHCLRHGKDIAPPCDPALNRDAQEILEAGLLAIQTGTTVNLPVRG